MIENMDLVSIHGLMVGNIQVNGRMVNNTEKGDTNKPTKMKGKEFGKMARGWNG
jgi:hypothetical protein